MPVTTTDLPDTLRVSFPVSSTEHSESEIVCFLRLVPTGLEINYAYHLIRSRAGSLGAFEEETKPRYLDLNASLAATIEHGVKEQFWSTFARTVRTARNNENLSDLKELYDIPKPRR